MNVYSDFSHSALKYLKDTEVNINNLLIMTGDFNIRDSLWDLSFPHHSSISDNLLIIADLFNLNLSIPTNSYPTRYSDTEGEADSVIDLMFLCNGSNELNCYELKLLEWSSRITLVLSNTRELDRELFLQTCLSYIVLQMVCAKYYMPYPK